YTLSLHDALPICRVLALFFVEIAPVGLLLALVAEEAHEVSDHLGDALAALGEDRLAELLHGLGEEDGVDDPLPGVVDGPGGDGGDEAAAVLVVLLLHAEEALNH